MPKLSEKRLAANRANATKSTGPRTPEGKARSSQNAVKHGFSTGSFTIVRIEDRASLEALRAEAIDAYQPVNSQELFAIERIALAQHSLLRVAALEAGLCTLALNDVVSSIRSSETRLCDEILNGAEISLSQSRAFFFAAGFQRVTGPRDSWKLFLRYQAQTERSYRRAVEEFERLKALRPELPNEPIEDVASEPVAPEEIIPQPSGRNDFDDAGPEIELPSPGKPPQPVRNPPNANAKPKS